MVLEHDPAGFLQCDLALSLDVIYHLVEDATFETYMEHLFSSARRFVIVYASDVDGPTFGHVREREFSRWVKARAPEFVLERMVENPYPYDPERADQTSKSNFYVYRRIAVP